MLACGSFETLRPALSVGTLATIRSFGFSSMTPVQAASIPAFLSHKDVLVNALTGSGKTLAFLIPIFEILHRRRQPLKNHQVGAIIVSPTRELAQQIFSVASRFKEAFPKLHVLELVGGTDVNQCKARFLSQGGNIVIATPGRLKYTLESLVQFDVSELEVLVFDEADRLLDMGFERHVSDILRRLPKQRRTGLFSATQTTDVVELARAGLRNPVEVDVKVNTKQSLGKPQESTDDFSHHAAVQRTPTSLQSFFLILKPAEKLNHLVHFLQSRPRFKCIVFVLTCACVDYISKILSRLDVLKAKGITIQGLHGRLAPKKRNAVYQSFVTANSGTLICTDVAARGIDIPDVEWIIQFDAPQDPSFFVHRVGRTARMGRSGRALLYLNPSEESYIDYLQNQGAPLRDMSKSPPADYGFDSITYDLNPPDILPEVQQLALADRDIMEKGQHAFVTYVRAYKEHTLKLIFILAKLNLGSVAKGLGLLYLPRLHDLKHLHIDFKAHTTPASSITYQDPQREKQRIASLQARKVKRQSEQTEREKKEKLKLNLKKQKGPKRRRKRLNLERKTEWEDLQFEDRLMKKLKRGKISKKDFEIAVGEFEGTDDSKAEISDELLRSHTSKPIPQAKVGLNSNFQITEPDPKATQNSPLDAALKGKHEKNEKKKRKKKKRKSNAELP